MAKKVSPIGVRKKGSVKKMSPVGPDPHPGQTDSDRVVDLIKEIGQEVHSTPQTPTPAPQAVTVLTVDMSVFSKGGRNSVNFRAPGAAVFNNPDAALVITDLRLAVFDQFVVGQVYTVTISTP